MEPEICEHWGCKATAVVYFVIVEDRRVRATNKWCDLHASSALSAYYKTTEGRLGKGVSSPCTGSTCFDIECLAHYQHRDQCWLSLREVDGLSRFPLTIGYPEFLSLYYVLQPMGTRRPLTHRAMADAITRLGGKLEYVVIDKLDQREMTYHAQLLIHRRDEVISVDVRPSDAAVLAVETGVPIFVRNDVLEQLRRSGRRDTDPG